jgi:hypothetical protein
MGDGGSQVRGGVATPCNLSSHQRDSLPKSGRRVRTGPVSYLGLAQRPAAARHPSDAASDPLMGRRLWDAAAAMTRCSFEDPYLLLLPK